MVDLEEELFDEEEEQGTFSVNDDSTAEWCVRQIKAAEAEKDLWKAHYKEELDKIIARQDRIIERMEFYLEQYFRKVPHTIAKTQESYRLPSAKLVVKKQQPEWNQDDEVLTPWVRTNYPSLIKESVSWGDFKKKLVIHDNEDGERIIATEDGLIVPGVTATDREDVFKVEVKK